MVVARDLTDQEKEFRTILGRKINKAFSVFIESLGFFLPVSAPSPLPDYPLV